MSRWMNGVVACVLAMVTVGDAIAQGPPPANVRFDAVRVDVVEQRREVVGELRASARSEVAAQEAGRVTEVLFEIGSTVERGDVLARLDRPDVGPAAEVVDRHDVAQRGGQAVDVEERAVGGRRQPVEHRRLAQRALGGPVGGHEDEP